MSPVMQNSAVCINEQHQCCLLSTYNNNMIPLISVSNK